MKIRPSNYHEIFFLLKGNGKPRVRDKNCVPESKIKLLLSYVCGFGLVRTGNRSRGRKKAFVYYVILAKEGFITIVKLCFSVWLSVKLLSKLIHIE